MPTFLIFNLTASLSSMGELAGHERRGSLMWPGRSALIGLMGAALGIDRDGDFSALDSLIIDVAIFESGAPLRDYHTIETVPTSASKKPNSRTEALHEAHGKTNTSITLRDYRTDAVFGIAVQGNSLERIERALNKPHYSLYLGRKSCPLSAPTGAKRVEAETSADALKFLQMPSWRRDIVCAHTLITDDPLGEPINDVPLDRQRWHFSTRRVGLHAVSIELQGGA